MVEERTQWNVAQLLKEPIGATRSYDVLAPAPRSEAELAQAEPLTGHISMLRTNRGILVEGEFEGSITVECSRCLRPLLLPVTVALQEEFQPTIDVVRGNFLPVEEEDSALLIDEHHVLDISEVLRQAVLLEVPLHALCKPDCAGLCQTCGKDLNEGPCGCPPSEVDPRWEQLGALLDDIEM